MSRLSPPQSHSHFSAAAAASSCTISLDSSRGPPTHRHDHSIPSGISAWDRQLRRLSVTPHMAPLQLWALALSSHHGSITGYSPRDPFSCWSVRLFLQHSSTAPTIYGYLPISLCSSYRNLARQSHFLALDSRLSYSLPPPALDQESSAAPY
ncbi:hypothetical protein CSAL01_04164 [Colletotrichum salicis]|uniref:Uncharacterized protein n=1 Tax=Colletotrichum salicis TaxID=1209931 RepID=A0A135TME4_9PEZI|nr:hypothetical protein CSAL01_04164 [Colletotrichum salicis]